MKCVYGGGSWSDSTAESLMHFFQQLNGNDRNASFK